MSSVDVGNLAARELEAPTAACHIAQDAAAVGSGAEEACAAECTGAWRASYRSDRKYLDREADKGSR